MKTFVLFDIDGTLLYSNKIDSLCFADSYERVFGHSFPSIDWREYPHVTDHVIFRTVFKQHFQRLATPSERIAFEKDYIRMLEYKRNETPDDFKEVPGASACWEALRTDERYVLGIATGGWQAPAQVKLKHIGINLNDVYAAYADGKETRDDILQEAIDRARAQYDITNVVYIGDAVWDVQTTQRMNIPFVGVRRNGDQEILKKLGAKVVINNFSDYREFGEAIDVALNKK